MLTIIEQRIRYEIEILKKEAGITQQIKDQVPSDLHARILAQSLKEFKTQLIQNKSCLQDNLSENLVDFLKPYMGLLELIQECEDQFLQEIGEVEEDSKGLSGTQDSKKHIKISSKKISKSSNKFKNRKLSKISKTTQTKLKSEAYKPIELYYQQFSES